VSVLRRGPADRASEDPAQTDAVPARPPRQHRARPCVLLQPLSL